MCIELGMRTLLDPVHHMQVNISSVGRSQSACRVINAKMFTIYNNAGHCAYVEYNLSSRQIRYIFNSGRFL